MLENNEKNFEISDDALENVSGGHDIALSSGVSEGPDALFMGGALICPRCNGWMHKMGCSNGTPEDDSDDIFFHECESCHYRM